MSILRGANALSALLNGVRLPFIVLSRWAVKLAKFKIPPWVRYSIHLILLGTVLIVLLYLNQRYEGYLLPDAPAWIRHTWPALAALLIYAAIRLVFYIVAQLPATSVAFPDIEEAVAEGQAALAAANLSITDVPLYLIVGLSPSQERSLLESSLIGKDVHVADADLPIHWYGDHRAIWVTMPGASAVVAQCKLSQSSSPARPQPRSEEYDPSSTFASGVEASRFATIGGGGGRFATQESVATEHPTPNPEGYHAPPRKLDADERDKIEKRIEFFSGLLKEARYPVCPINGVLYTVPYSWTTSPGLGQLADTVKIDMSTLQKSLGVKCLSIVAFIGIEQSPEFKTYIERLDKPQVERRCGCGYPSLITPDTKDIELTHTWIVRYFERQVFELFQRKLGDPTNGDLFRLLDKIRKNRSSFVRILKNAFPDDVEEPFYLGGVYFASLESAAGVKFPFLEGLFARLLKEHDEVIGWSDSALKEDRQLQRVSKGILVAAAAMVIVNAILILMMLPLGLG